MIDALQDSYLAHGLEAALAATLLILLVLAIRKPVARHFGAGIAYALWMLPIARLILPPLPNEAASLFSWLKVSLPAAPTSTQTITETTTITAAPEAALGAAAEMPVWATPAPPMAEPASLAATPAAAPEAMDLVMMAGLVGLAVWLGGSLFFLARSLRNHATFMNVVEREGTPVTGDLQDLSIEVAREAGLKRMPRIFTSLISSGPFVTGLFRPAVVLPAWFAEDYSRAEARAAIAHELTHVKRGDLWALQAAEIFVALMWFNPLAYIAREAFRIDQEAACDADVLRRGHASPHAYGATLVKAVRMQMPARMALTTSLPLTHALKERLKLMSYPAPDARRRWIGFGAAVLLGTTALAGTASIAAAGERDEQKDVKIENGALWVDGEKVDNRQIILLSDPVKGLVPVPPLPPEVTELSIKMSKDAQELVGPEVLGAVMELTGSPEFEEITQISLELGLMGAQLGTEAAFESLRMNFSGMSEEEIEAWAEDFETRMEAKAAAIEARAAEMEARSEAIEAQVEERSALMQAKIDEATEKRVIAIERRMEADAARLESIIEQHYGEDFEARINARTDLIPEMVDECVAMNLPEGETRIVERKTDDGTSVKIACVAGQPDMLANARTISFIKTNSSLSDEEKQKFLEQSDGKKRTFILSNDAKVKTRIERKALPAPATTPEPPAPPAIPDELNGPE